MKKEVVAIMAMNPGEMATSITSVLKKSFQKQLRHTSSMLPVQQPRQHSPMRASSSAKDEPILVAAHQSGKHSRVFKTHLGAKDGTHPCFQYTGLASQAECEQHLSVEDEAAPC